MTLKNKNKNIKIIKNLSIVLVCIKKPTIIKEWKE